MLVRIVQVVLRAGPTSSIAETESRGLFVNLYYAAPN